MPLPSFPSRLFPRLILLISVLWGLFASASATAAADASARPATAKTPPVFWRPLNNPATAQTLLKVQERAEELRGITLGHPVTAFVLDSRVMQGLLLDAVENETSESIRADEAFLKSLAAAPDAFDLIKTYGSLMDEQAAGVYDEKSKNLFVHEHFDLAASELAQVILSHEVCHALQDKAFSLKMLFGGAGESGGSDRALAGLSVAEGDAMLLMEQFSVKHGTVRQIQELPGALLMNQAALKAAPAVVQQELLFPYIQGEAFLKYLIALDKKWRDEAFRRPPLNTSQVIHPEKYLRGDLPASLTLQGGVPAEKLPAPPSGFTRLKVGARGEFGIRALLTERLGGGMGSAAAEGWNGDALAVYVRETAREAALRRAGAPAKACWWFCWETAWDGDVEARRFADAWVTLWRVVGKDKKLGHLGEESQSFKAAPWTVTVERAGRRVVLSWWN